MQRDIRADHKEGGDRASSFQPVCDVRQGTVGQTIAVVCQEHWLIPQVRAHGEQTLRDRCVEAGINERDSPVGHVWLKQLDLASPVSDYKIVRDPFLVMDEEL